MHASQLAEIATWVATHATSLVFGEAETEMSASNEYWTASKCRLQRWIVAMKMFEKDIEDTKSNHNPWPALEVVVQEVLLSEMLTRIWAATVQCHDDYHQTDTFHGLAHSTFISHIEVRNRAVRLLMAGQGDNEEIFERFNVLRRKLGRWTDLFLSQMPILNAAQKFAFDKKRVADFYHERRESSQRANATRQQLLMASFVEDVKPFARYSANPSFNRQIASGILGCFSSNRFDSVGLPKSVQMLWLEKSQVETQALVDHLTDFEQDSLTTRS